MDEMKLERGETETEESWGSSAGRAEQVMERGRPAVTATGAKQATDHAQAPTERLSEVGTHTPTPAPCVLY